MPKYWGKNYFAHGSFQEVGQKQKKEKKERRANDGNNNGQATHGARKHAWRTQAAWAKMKTRGRITLDCIAVQYHFEPHPPFNGSEVPDCLLNLQSPVGSLR